MSTTNSQATGATIILIIVAVLAFCKWVYPMLDQSCTDRTPIVTVQDLQQQQILGGSKSSVSTEIRYIVICDSETFVIKSSLANWKFNNSDIFYRLERGKKYRLNVAGSGKGFLTDYRNILSFEKVE